MQSSPQPESYNLLHRMFDSLMQSERAAPETLAAHQQQTLHQLVAHAANHTAYYSKRLGHLMTSSGESDIGKWASIEPVSRNEVVSGYHDFVARVIPSNHGYTRIRQTSGSSSRALRIPCTSMTDIADNAALYRHYAGHEVDCSLPLVQIRVFDRGVRRPEAVPFDPATWGPPWLEKSRRGPWHRQSAFTAIDDQVERLRGMGAHCYVNTFPSHVRRLAEHLESTGTRLDNVAAVFTAGEPVGDAVRSLCRTWLGCDMIDLYSTAECGVVATECPSGGGYHVQSEICLVEVLRGDGGPAAPGETGDVAITPFYNFAMPLIRYRTGDIATAAAPCACGRTLPVLGRTITPDASRIELGGGIFWTAPEEFVDRVNELLGSRQWKIVQKSDSSVALRYSRLAGAPMPDPQSAVGYLGSLLGSTLTIGSEEVEIVGRGPGGKFSWIARTPEAPI